MCQCTDWLSATSSGTRIGGGVIALEFVSPLIPIRLLVVFALPARRPPSDRSWRRCPPGRARDGPLAGCPRLSPACCVSRASRQCPWLLLAASLASRKCAGGGSQAVSRASRQYPGLRGAQEVSVAGRQYQPLGSHAFSRAKGQFSLQQYYGSLVPAPWCVLHSNIQVGPGRTAVPQSRRPRSVRLPSLVPRRHDWASQRRHGVLRQHSINAHSSDRGACCAGAKDLIQVIQLVINNLIRKINPRLKHI